MLHLDRILHPTDFSPAADRAFDHALFLASASGGPLDVLHVIEHPPIVISDDYFERAREEAKAQLSRLRRRGRQRQVALTTRIWAAGDQETAASCILDDAAETNPALIVVGTRGRRGLTRWLIGSTAEKIIRRAQQNVYVVGDEASSGSPSFDHILAPTDFSAQARHALDVAMAWSHHFDARLSMLHVLESHPPPGIYGMEEASDPKWTQRVEDAARDELQEWHETLQDQAPNVHARLESGEAAAVLLDYAEENDVDLLILGSHGRTGVERFLLGSTTEKVIRSAPCPVLVVKPSPRDGDSD
jgi:nucleotide-binding universal stress UspA family protein